MSKSLKNHKKLIYPMNLFDFVEFVKIIDKNVINYFSPKVLRASKGILDFTCDNKDFQITFKKVRRFSNSYHSILKEYDILDLKGVKKMKKTATIINHNQLTFRIDGIEENEVSSFEVPSYQYRDDLNFFDVQVRVNGFSTILRFKFEDSPKDGNVLYWNFTYQGGLKRLIVNFYFDLPKDDLIDKEIEVIEEKKVEDKGETPDDNSRPEDEQDKTFDDDNNETIPSEDDDAEEPEVTLNEFELKCEKEFGKFDSSKEILEKKLHDLHWKKLQKKAEKVGIEYTNVSETIEKILNKIFE